MKAQLTQARLKELLHYEPETGVFTYRVDRGSRPAGTVAGRMDSKGYVQIGLDLHRVLAHRLAFLYMEGAIPVDPIDHINHSRNDNSWQNLRVADPSKNAQNRIHRSDNKSGVKGVCFTRGKWHSSINYRGRRHHLGVFETLEDAKEFTELAREMCHGEFAYAG